MEKRRRHKRVPLAAAATLTFQEGEDIFSLEATTADISFSGIGLYVDRPLKDETAVSIEISFVVGAGLVETETLKGNVVYTNHIRNDAHFIGVEFNEELNAASHPALYSRLQNILKWD